MEEEEVVVVDHSIKKIIMWLFMRNWGISFSKVINN